MSVPPRHFPPMSNMSLRDLLARIAPRPKTDIAGAPGSVPIELEPHRLQTQENVRPPGTFDRGTITHTSRYAVVRMDGSGECYPSTIQSRTFQSNDASKPPVEIYRRYLPEDASTDLDTAKSTVTRLRAEFMQSLAWTGSLPSQRPQIAPNQQPRMSL